MKTKRLLVICGPTATGKTNLVLHLAKKFNGELVSADSRQVYKEMDIGTGKDLPKNVKCQMSNVKARGRQICFYETGKTRLWGYDLVNPSEEFSVGQYIEIAWLIIKDVWKRGKLPILVGGTGLYIKGVVEGIPTASIPKNKDLRKQLSKKSAEELLDILKGLDFNKAKSLNESDRKNPRRLIRAIEIEKYKRKNPSDLMYRYIDKKLNILKIGLKVSKEILGKRIDKRVEKRVGQGIVEEIKKLLKSGVGWEDQSMQSLGYRQWRDFFKGSEGQEGAVSKWKQAEKQYAKRQITWFKKDKEIKWFDVAETELASRVEKLVRKWHNKSISKIKFQNAK